MPLAEHDHVIEALSANATNEPFREWVLPRTSCCGEHFVNAHSLNPASEMITVDSVTVPYQILRQVIFRECFDDLLGCPFGRGMVSHVEMQYAATFMCQHKNTNNTFNCSVGTVKKSMETNWPTWLLRKLFQVWDGSVRRFGIKREMVRSEIATPSFRSSPWIRGAPQSGLASAMVRTSLRISALTRGRPTPFACDNLHQYRLNRLRCHEITVSGRTMTRTDFQSRQIARSPIQKSRSHRRSLGRFRCRLKMANC